MIDGFLKIWKQHFFPNINQFTGSFNDREIIKRVRSNPPTPTNTLESATKRARIEGCSSGETNNESYDESEMDAQIRKYFLGKSTYYYTVSFSERTQ